MSNGVNFRTLCIDLRGQLDLVTAERDAALAELAQANEKIDKAWNRKSATDHKGFIPGAMDAWKRPVPQHLPYDFSGNPGASATQYCNGWNDSGSYWSAHAYELQQRLTAADERADVLEGVEARYHWLQKATPYRFKKIQDASVTDGGDVLYFHADRFDAAVDAAMKSTGASVEYGPTPGCKQCEEAESCGFTDCPECDAQLHEDVTGTGFRSGYPQ